MQQRSPPRSSPAGPPDYRMTLPSLKIAIGDLPDPGLRAFACLSPSMGRPFASYASPASYTAYPTMSPPGPPSHHNWRTTTGNSNASTLSGYPSSTSVSVSAPASSIITPSPAASGPSSLTTLPEHDQEEQEEGRRMHHVPTMETNLLPKGEVRFITQYQPKARSNSSLKLRLQPPKLQLQPPKLQPKRAARSQPQPQSPPEPKPRPKLEAQQPQPKPARDPASAARSTLGPFKCTHDGCNVAPFQTQYLLNSHVNVHSNERTHFCAVQGCPRGYGGLGFKRKNEMIRHGLVHTSPGYMCPFCPKQSHRYPRPDNLQRHVRKYHSDEDRLDPKLRAVLNQRTDGNNKAEKRRTRLS
ncbi:uncharacterized protein PV07_12865 [Cladophialophora immunda]|uniref:C2H2-type domain-containing protein n=1 Tax=Cladophialophora immunda TaxID=569365 RepID=A0A0D2AAA5_9EURO|nr:uncharacterized protein PV07_12865 [Cladophialophora immunda]KIW21702.1 hypothetical protein PV07_12865 [Cladophialophora immunda]